jgi:hypothetical protein
MLFGTWFNFFFAIFIKYLKPILVMRKFFILFNLLPVSFFAQEHFSGISTSSKIGMLSAGTNPSELANISNKFETNIFSFSLNVNNNKIGFNDITSGKNLETLIFQGSDEVNMRTNTEVFGPSFSMKYKKWAFGINSKANINLDIIDVNSKLGDVVSNSTNSTITSSTTISSKYNQRVNGVTWGEIGVVAARNIFENDTHKFNAGLTVKLLFPGSYANIGVSEFEGTINRSGSQLYLNDAVANVNIAYSGSLANNFTNFNDYYKSVFGSLAGIGTDIGINYQWKDATLDPKNKNKYKLNVGLSVRNIGTMTYKDSNNFSTNYSLKIQSTIAKPFGLDLNQFENVQSIQEIETILLNNGYLTKVNQEKDFKVKLPTTLSLYADAKVISKFYVGFFLQQGMLKNDVNNQTSSQNSFTVTPRFYTNFIEIFAPQSTNSISGFNSGFGFRLGGFYIGSNSVVTALLANKQQADIYTGFRWAFL